MTSGPVPARFRTDRVPIGAGVGLVGVVLTVLGTFLPWVESGGVERPSYAVAGLLHRLDLIDDNGIRLLLAVWPFAGPLCVLPVVAAILRAWRVAGALALAIGLAIGAVSLGVIAYGTGRSWFGVTLVSAGPTVSVAGAAILVVAGLILITQRRSIPTALTQPGGDHH